MTNKRHTRADSAAGQVAAMSGALAAPISPPAHIVLRPADRPFWDSVVRARARDKWDDLDLTHAANLARCLCDIERLTVQIQAEGDVVKNAKGTPVMNPKHTLLETLSRRAVALSRTLHVHAEAKIGPAKVERGKATAQREAAAAVDELDDDDDLIARPGAAH